MLLKSFNSSMNKIKVSVVISTRDEGHNLTHTIHSLINDLETFLSPDEFEIIVVWNTPHSSEWWFLMERGLTYHRTLKHCFDPIAGNVTARNKGAYLASGDILFFCDAHMSIKPGTMERMCNGVRESGGIVHVPVQWMGGYEPAQPSYQYSIKIGEKIWGTWGRRKIASSLYAIPATGHCFFAVSRDQFLGAGGYAPPFRCYGGGELYLALKWWALGYGVYLEPNGLVYHLSAGRGYQYHQDDLVHNMMLLGYALGCPALGERVYLTYVGKHKTPRLEYLHTIARAAGERDHRDWSTAPSYTPVYDVLTHRPWDRYNESRHGTAHSDVVVFHESWLNSITNEARTLHNASELQRGLASIVNELYRTGAIRG